LDQFFVSSLGTSVFIDYVSLMADGAWDALVSASCGFAVGCRVYPSDELSRRVESALGFRPIFQLVDFSAGQLDPPWLL
jgi:hypothetical protein